MFLEDARGRKLAELVADHIFGYEHGHEGFAIMDVKRVADEIRRHCAAARPSFDGFFYPGFIHAVNFLEEFPLDVGTFF